MEEELIKFLSDRLGDLQKLLENSRQVEQYEIREEELLKKLESLYGHLSAAEAEELKNIKNDKTRLKAELEQLNEKYEGNIDKLKNEFEIVSKEFEEVSTAVQDKESSNSKIEQYNKTKEKLLAEYNQYNQELEKLGKRYSFEDGKLQETRQIKELNDDLKEIQAEIASLDQKIEESQEKVKYCDNVLNKCAKKYSIQEQAQVQEQEKQEIAEQVSNPTNPVQPQQTEEQPEAVVEQTNSEKTMSRFGDEEELKKLSKQELVSKMVSVIQDEISQKDFPKNIMDIRKNVTRIPGLNFEASKVPFIYELIEDLGIDHLDFIGFGEDDRYPQASSSLRGIERVLNCLEPHLKTESDRLSDDSEYIDRFKELMVKTLDFITLLNEKGILEDKIKVDNLMKGSWIDYESTLDEATNSITGINRTQTKSEPEADSPQSEKDPEKKKQPTVAENKTRQGDIPTGVFVDLDTPLGDFEDISTDGQGKGAHAQDIYFDGRNSKSGDLTEEELKKTGDNVRKAMAEKKAKAADSKEKQEGNSTKSTKTTDETEPKTTKKVKKTTQTATKTTPRQTEPKVSADREGPKPKLIIDASTGMVTFTREGEVPVEVKLEKTLLGRIGRSSILRDAKKFLGKDAPSVYMGLFGNKYNTAVISVLMKAGEKGLLENYLSKEYEGYNSLKNMGFDYSTNLENYTISDSQFRILNRALVHDGEDLNAEKRLGGRRNLLAKQIAYKLGLSSEGLPVAKQDKHDVKKNEEAKEDAKYDLLDAAQEDYLAKLATESKKLKEQIEKCSDEYKKKILLEKMELVKRKRAYIKLLQKGETTEQEKIQKSVDIVEKKVAIAHLEKDDPKLSDEKRNQKIYNYTSLYIKFAEQKLRDDRISDTERVALEEGLRRSRMELDRMNPNDKDNYEKSFRDRMRYDVERRNKLYENSKSDRSKSAKKNLRKVIGKYKEAKEGRMYGSRTTLGKAIARMRYEIAARKAIKNKGTEKGE